MKLNEILKPYNRYDNIEKFLTYSKEKWIPEDTLWTMLQKLPGDGGLIEKTGVGNGTREDDDEYDSRIWRIAGFNEDGVKAWFARIEFYVKNNPNDAFKDLVKLPVKSIKRT